MESMVKVLLLVLVSPFFYLIFMVLKWIVISAIEIFKKFKFSKSRKLFQLVFFCYFFVFFVSFFVITDTWIYLLWFPFMTAFFVYLLRWWDFIGID